MPKFTLNVRPAAGDERFVGVDANNPLPGEQLLWVDVPLIDPTTNQPVGSLSACVTFMRTSGDALLLGIAEHRLQDGTVSLQGTLRQNEVNRVSAITGGTGKYERARGTVSFEDPGLPTERITYDIGP
jgi:hypothetical protein